MSKIEAFDGTMIDERDVAVESAAPGTPIYNIRSMNAYAKSKGKTMAELSDEERKPYIRGFVQRNSKQGKISKAM